MAQIIRGAVLKKGGIEPSPLTGVPHDLSMYRQVIVGVEVDVFEQGEGGKGTDVGYEYEAQEDSWSRLCCDVACPAFRPILNPDSQPVHHDSNYQASYHGAGEFWEDVRESGYHLYTQ